MPRVGNLLNGLNRLTKDFRLRRNKAWRFGLAVGCTLVALFARLALGPLLLDQLPFVTFFAAIAVSVWVGGWGPGLASAVLGFAAADLFCVRHNHPLSVITRVDVAVSGSYLLVAAAIVMIGQAVQTARERALARKLELETEVERRIQAYEELHRVRNELQARSEVQLSEQAALLQHAHDAILVTDLHGAISFWNHGAEVLYGWLSEAAMGANAHDLLCSAFPIPLSEIVTLLQNQGQWNGEITHRAQDGPHGHRREPLVSSSRRKGRARQDSGS